MALLKSKDAAKMELKSRNEKIRELKIELMKSLTLSQKSAGKTKEIKRTIARLKTFNAAESARKRK